MLLNRRLHGAAPNSGSSVAQYTVTGSAPQNPLLCVNRMANHGVQRARSSSRRPAADEFRAASSTPRRHRLAITESARPWITSITCCATVACRTIARSARPSRPRCVSRAICRPRARKSHDRRRPQDNRTASARPLALPRGNGASGPTVLEGVESGRAATSSSRPEGRTERVRQVGPMPDGCTSSVLLRNHSASSVSSVTVPTHRARRQTEVHGTPLQRLTLGPATDYAPVQISARAARRHGLDQSAKPFFARAARDGIGVWPSRPCRCRHWQAARRPLRAMTSMRR